VQVMGPHFETRFFKVNTEVLWYVAPY
jgi:hypothetical protein